MLFADLTGYTRITHQLGPERTHAIVDAYLRMAREVIVKWNGFVVQFAGDEIMALFNVPLHHDDYVGRAVAAASEIQSRMEALSERFDRKLQATVGIASGHARVGRQGSDEMKDYTAVGEVVIRAARLVSNVEPGGILVDSAIFDGVRRDFPDASRHQPVFRPLSAHSWRWIRKRSIPRLSIPSTTVQSQEIRLV